MRNEAFLSQIEGFNKVKESIANATREGVNMEQKSEHSLAYINQLHPKKIILTVEGIIEETETVKTIRLKASDGCLPPFEAGQYVNLTVKIEGVSTSRAYSISSAPSQAEYFDITVKKVDGGFVSNYLLDKLIVGDQLESTGPTGNFHYNPLFHGNDLVMLAGGSGVTPMMSMIRQYVGVDSDKKIHLIYICRTPEEFIFSQELENFESENENFVYSKIISRPKPDYQGITGHISVELLKTLLTNITDKTYYICGPSGMCDSAKADLLSLSVRPGKIRQETFGETSDVTKMSGWPKTISKGAIIKVATTNGVSFDVPVGEPLLNSLDRVGISIPSSCHSGECSLCRVKLLDGDVFQLPGSKERESDKKYGYIHSCSSYPTTDIKLEI